MSSDEARANRIANGEAYNALWLERATTNHPSMMTTTWRRTKWAVLIRFAWWLANTPDAPDMWGVWSASNYVEWLRWRLSCSDWLTITRTPTRPSWR